MKQKGTQLKYNKGFIIHNNHYTKVLYNASNIWGKNSLKRKYKSYQLHQNLIKCTHYFIIEPFNISIFQIGLFSTLALQLIEKNQNN